jgi:hypothetical protein
MIDIEDGLSMNGLPVALEHVRDIDSFEGPLLSEFKSSNGEPYLYYWCDRSKTHNRWLVVRTTKREILRYEVGETPLRTLIHDCPDRFVYVCDRDRKGTLDRTVLAPVDKLPSDYFPTDASYAYGTVSQLGQNVLLGRGWKGFESVSTYPRKYLQSVSFLSFFGAHGNPSIVWPIDYHFKGGWVFHTLYEKIRVSLGDAMPDLEEIAFASPGYMRFSVGADAAADLRETLSRFIEKGTELRAGARTLREWSNGKVQITERQALGILEFVGNGLAIKTEALLKRTGTHQQAAKILASLVNRLEFLAAQHQDGTATIVGLEAQDKASTSAAALPEAED